jgi:hypothetical protein
MINNEKGVLGFQRNRLTAIGTGEDQEKEHTRVNADKAGKLNNRKEPEGERRKKKKLVVNVKMVVGGGGAQRWSDAAAATASCQ